MLKQTFTSIIFRYSLFALVDANAKSSRTSVRLVILYLFLSPLSEPQSSPSRPEPRHSSQRDSASPLSLFKRAWITIKFLLTSDITASLKTGSTSSKTIRPVFQFCWRSVCCIKPEVLIDLMILLFSLIFIGSVYIISTLFLLTWSYWNITLELNVKHLLKIFMQEVCHKIKK